ncbi:MAG: LysR substrate-binding domain-containing protein [Pseudorhodoferax sp.]
MRIVASVSAIAELLLDDVAEFMRDAAQPEHPDRYRGALSEGPGARRRRRRCVDRRAAGTTPTSARWRRRPYRGDELVLAVHADHPLARRQAARSPTRWAGEHVGLPAARRGAVDAGARGRARRAAITTARWSPTSTPSLRCVRAGLGIAVVPREVVQLSAADKGLRVVELTDAWATRHFAICLRDEALLSPSAQLLLAHLQAQAAACAAGPARLNRA